MNSIPLSAARENLEQTMERVCDDHNPVIITRQDARPVVLMSLEDYESLDATAYLLSSPANAARLRQSREEARAGSFVEWVPAE